MDEAIFARGEELGKEIGHFFAKVNGHAGGGDIGIVVPPSINTQRRMSLSLSCEARLE